MVKSTGLKSYEKVQSVATKTKNLNTETEMVGMATVLSGSCPKLNEADFFWGHIFTKSNTNG